MQHTASGDSPLGPGKQEPGSFLQWVHQQQQSDMSKKPNGIAVLAQLCFLEENQLSRATNQLGYLSSQAENGKIQRTVMKG